MRTINKRLIIRYTAIFGAVALAGIAFSGCLFGAPPDVPEQEPVEMTSPAAVITNISVAYNQRNIDLYKAAMSSNFVFYFNPADVGQNPPGGSTYVIPESWTYTEDWQATDRMFQLAYSIDLAIPTGSIGEPEEGATTYRAENVTISLLVMVDELNGYIANQGFCDFEFEQYKNNNGEYRWRLTGWWDNTNT
ncbi:MAG: hypothetical protein PVH29_08125 [Candidatus Zixiibacteriota bacterium]|jgi:hypothetical protein